MNQKIGDEKTVQVRTAQVKTVAKTLVETDSPYVKRSCKKVAKTLMDTSIPPTAFPLEATEKSQQKARKVARTMVEMKRPSIEERRNFLAKTRLDRLAISEVVLKFELRQEQRQIDEARARADQPVIQIGAPRASAPSSQGDLIDSERLSSGKLDSPQRVALIPLAVLALILFSLALMLFMPTPANQSETNHLWSRNIGAFWE
jgi:hypothetical protein